MPKESLQSPTEWRHRNPATNDLNRGRDVIQTYGSAGDES